MMGYRWIAVCAVLFCLTPLASAQFNRDVPKFSPMPDGVVSEDEMLGQLVVPMIWPVEHGAIPLDGSGFSEEEISATWFVSWDDMNLNIAAVVKDDTPLYQVPAGDGNVPYNAQDVMQPVFNPFNDPDHFFVDGQFEDEDPGDDVAAIYDIVVETADEFGPDIYRHGPKLDADEWESITVAGTINEDESGYTVEAVIPWATAMDDADPDYKPTIGDEHGLSFIVLGFAAVGGAENATLFTDFGEGANTIGDPTTWNSITLVAGTAVPGDYDADGELNAGDLDVHAQYIKDANLAGDVNGDGVTNVDDRNAWTEELQMSWLGDSNFDGEFNSGDLVQVFTPGKYETFDMAGYSEGDWNGDMLFNSSDLVAAFTTGGYEKGPRGKVNPVPEPASFFMLMAGLIGIAIRR